MLTTMTMSFNLLGVLSGEATGFGVIVLAALVVFVLRTAGRKQ